MESHIVANGTTVRNSTDYLDYSPGDADEYNNQHYTELVVIMIMLAIFSVVGVTGNALVLYVYSQKRDRQVANHFIIVLAIVDFTTCIMVIPFTMYYEYVDKTIKNDFLCKLYHFLITSMVPFSVLEMVAIAIDRYLCICHPFRQALTLIRAKALTIIMAVFSAGLGIIVACMYGIYNKYPISQLVKYGLDVSQYGYTNQSLAYNSDELVVVNMEYCSINNLIFDYSVLNIYHKFYTTLYLVCLIIIIVLYALIYKLVRYRRAKRLAQQSSRLLPVNHDSTFSGSPITDVVTLNGEGSKSGNFKTDQDNKSPGNSIKSHHSSPPSHQNRSPPSSKKSCTWQNEPRVDSRKERMRLANLKTAAMLFVVTVVFVITYMPAFVMSMFQPDEISRIALYLYFANNVANPVIYSFMNTNFREDLSKIFSR